MFNIESNVFMNLDKAMKNNGLLSSLNYILISIIVLLVVQLVVIL